MCKCVDGCGECVPQLKKPKPHPHAALIKAWADGATIQIRVGSSNTKWEDYGIDDTPLWLVDCSIEYRIKPEPKPDVVMYGWVGNANEKRVGANAVTIGWCNQHRSSADRVQYTFDAETGKLKDVCLIK